MEYLREEICSNISKGGFFVGNFFGLKDEWNISENNVQTGDKIHIELTPTAGNESFYEKAGFKYKPDKITGMYL